MRGSGIIGTILLVWLLIGVFAAYQRDYFKTSETSCATAGTIALTVVAGPLNYAGGPTPRWPTATSTSPSPASNQRGVDMIAIGVILVILGLVFAMPVLTYVGVVALVIGGAVFWLLGALGHAVGGRRVWY